jgi:hypothetical protein
MKTAADWIRLLDLQAHPEGGHYREIYRSNDVIQAGALPARFIGPRAAATSVYFCLAPGERSILHRIKADEIWHFYDGTGLNIHCFFDDLTHRIIPLGRNFEAGELFQAVIPGGCWFGAEGAGPDDWALFGSMVAPGFDFSDFELGRRDDLVARFPNHAEIVCRLTR